MPGPITHLKAAHEFAQNRLLEAELPAFYLGAISPDSVNINGHADKSVRWPAHLRNSDLDLWLKNAKEFYDVNKNTIDNAYLKGYILHIVTDIVWDKYFEAVLCTVMYKKEIPPKEFKSTRWAELYGFEQTQIKTDWLNNVLQMLSMAEPQKIGTLKIEEIEKFKQKVLSLDLEKGRPPQLLNDDFLASFFEKVVDEAKKIIEN